MIVIIDNNDHDNIDDNFNDKFFATVLIIKSLIIYI